MTRRSEYRQPSLFETDKPHVVLPPAKMSELAMLVEALLAEIAAALAIREVGDDQDHD